jgi:vacuolar-type H+-ATPase subunit E/Vma4
MNAQAILDKIGQDAQEAALRMAGEATAKVAVLKSASRAKIESMHAATVAQAQRDSVELEQRTLRMAELEQRKAMLAQKRSLIDEAFARAGALMADMPPPEKRAFFVREVVRYARGGEVLAVSLNAPWFDEAFLADVNAAMAALKKPADLTLAPERPQVDEGVILRQGGAEVHCTFAVLLNDARAQWEQQVAADLFAS